MDDAKGQLLVIQLQNFSYSWISFSRSEKWDFFHSLVKKVTSFCCSKSDAWLLKASSCMFSHEKRVEKWVQSLLCLKVHQKENIYLCEMFKQIQKYVLVDKKVLWVSPVYPNMSLILDRLDPFNYSLSKRNKKYQVNQLLHTWEEWSTAISVQNNCCPRAIFVMKLKKRFSLSVALWWYCYHYRDLFLPLQQNQESHQYQIEACLDEIFCHKTLHQY